MNVPALAIGAIVAAYWGRVLRLSRKMRRKTGRAGNLIPAEPLGRALRVVWAPAVLVWVTHPFITGFSRRLPQLLQPVWSAGVVGSWAAVAVAAGCFAATLACWKRMGRSWRMGIDPAETTPLVATGPYAYVRHPIYSLSQLMMLATLAVVPTAMMIAAAIVHVALLQWESLREERHLLRGPRGGVFHLLRPGRPIHPALPAARGVTRVAIQPAHDDEQRSCQRTLAAA